MLKSHSPFVVYLINLGKGIVFDHPESRVHEYCDIEIYEGYDNQHSVNDIM